MVAAAGNHVARLQRTAFGALQLPQDLAPGQWHWVEREAIAQGL
jgi:16S rRNA pseudouridine516 synthase